MLVIVNKAKMMLIMKLTALKEPTQILFTKAYQGYKNYNPKIQRGCKKVLR